MGLVTPVDTITRKQPSASQLRFFDVVLSDMAPRTTGIKEVDAENSLLLCEQVSTRAQSAIHSVVSRSPPVINC